MIERQAESVLISLYRDNFDDLVRLGSLLLGNVAEAEEVASDSLLKFHTTRRRPAQGKEAAWLRKVVLNGARNRKRRRLLGKLKEELVYVGEETFTKPPSSLGSSPVVVALQGLSTRQREVLVLRYYLQYSEADAAQFLGISVNSIKTHARRGLAGLRKVLEESDE